MSVTIRPRADWQNPAQPVKGPPPFLASVVRVVIHYTAAAKIPADIAPYLRAIHNDYTVNRGYSIGYNWAVDKTGVCWELRGFQFKCAANKGFNDTSLAILVLVDGDQPATEPQADTVRELVRLIRRTIAGARQIVGHGELMATGCPGAGLRAQIKAGRFDPDFTPSPPIPQEDEMKTLHVFVPGDASRAEAVVQIRMDGFDNPIQRDHVIKALRASAFPCTREVYDALLAAATAEPD